MIWSCSPFEMSRIILLLMLMSRQTASMPCSGVENMDGSKPSCYEVNGCFWDQSQCSICSDTKCECSTYLGCDTCTVQMYYDQFINVCQYCPEGCASCCRRRSLTKLVCTTCENGYTLINGVCVYVLGCKDLIPDTSMCFRCQDKYFLDENLKCQSCDPSCKTCLTQFDCIECTPGLFYKSSAFSSVCIACTCLNQYICDINGICIAAPSTPVSLTCHQTPMIAHCDSSYYDFNQATCLCNRCLPGYYLNREVANYACLECPPNVARCTSLFVVVECAEGFVLDLKTLKCVDNTLPNCRRMYDGDCVDCYSGNYPEQDDTSGMQLCYTKDLSAGSCAQYTNKGLGCLKCMDGSYLNSNNQCQSCNTSILDSSCVSCVAEGDCTRCNLKYRVNGGVCVACLNPYCDNCDFDEGYCIRCQNGYGLNPLSRRTDNQCLQCQVGCNKCDVDFRKCTQCKPSYYNQNFTCKQIPDHCIENQNEFCITCETGYIARGGFCLLCKNDSTGRYNCPNSCIEANVSLVDLLHSHIITPSKLLTITLMLFSYLL